jgi:tRNA(Ile)-lysidine synthase
MTITGRVRDTIRRHGLLRRSDRVVVALSGGPDSVALFRLLRELEADGDLTVAGVAHLNHGLREAAHHDERFARALATDAGVTFRSDLVDVRARAALLRTSLEDAGRRARYELFERVATELDAEAIATGHTRDDQAETFLLRLLRGAGPRGLGGIHYKAYLPAEAPKARRWVIRPLLDLGRDELRAYLTAINQSFCEDESNRDIGIPRNKIRHELLPLLQREYSPQIVDVLAREALIAQQDEDRLQQEAIDLLDSIVLVNRAENLPVETVELNASALRGLPPALAARVAREALRILAPDRFLGTEHVEGLLDLVRSDAARSLSLPGQQATRRGDVAVLTREPFEPFSNSFRVSLSIPGEVTLEREGWVISAGDSGTPDRDSPPDGLGTSDRDSPRLSAAVNAGALAPPLTVRSRQPGDRFNPAGMGGQSKKLQDFFVDRKVPRERRDSLPLVVDSVDRIVWIVGESVAEDFRVTEPSQGVIFLKARRLGGQG